MKHTCALFSFEKRAEKQPTTQTAMTTLHRPYLIEKFRISITSKGSDIQRLYLWLIWPGDQVLFVASH